MSELPVEMKTIPAGELKRDNVFEMFGNLYQVDWARKPLSSHVHINAHIIAQVGQPKLPTGDVFIRLESQTPVSIEA